jgi:hypothetical protein
MQCFQLAVYFLLATQTSIVCCSSHELDFFSRVFALVLFAYTPVTSTLAECYTELYLTEHDERTYRVANIFFMLIKSKAKFSIFDVSTAVGTRSALCQTSEVHMTYYKT